MKVGFIYLIIALSLLIISFIKSREKTKKALKISAKVAANVWPVLFLVFVLMGVISVFVSRETIASLLGKNSGLLGIIISELMGSVALIEPSAVFPFSGMLLQKGADFGVIYAFIMIAILLGITTLPLEIQVFSKKFTIIRNGLLLILIFIMAIIFKFIF